MAYLGKTPSQAVRSRYYFTASGGETSLSPSEVTGLSFTDANYVDVSLNGVALVSGTDYTATPSTNTISSLSALTASDVVEIVVYDTFSVFGGNVNGDFNISGGDLTLGDNDKAIFGAGSDLQIYHDGSNSYITEGGDQTGDLFVRASNLKLTNASGDFFLWGRNADSVRLYHNNAQKLETTSTGVDVTGTVTADGLTVDVNNAGITMTDSSSTAFEAIKTTTSDALQFSSGGSGSFMNFYTNAGNERMRIESSGNVGIGTTTGDVTSDGNASRTYVTIQGTANRGRLNLGSTASNGADVGTLGFTNGANTVAAISVDSDAGSQTNGLMAFATSGATRMTITSGGHVGIGAANPNRGSHDRALLVSNTGTGARSAIEIEGNSSNANGTLTFLNNGTSAASIDNRGGGTLTFNTGSSLTERMRIESGGDILFGKTASGIDSPGMIFNDEGASNFSLAITSYNDPVLFINRQSADGTLVQFRHANTTEGSIVVSGTTVSYNGGHLSRWSQLTDGTEDTTIVKGTVMTNLDQMAVWHHEAQPATYYEEGDELPEGVSVGDEKTPAVDAYDEDNEQLNCMAVSSVEGDANVAGVFVNWDYDDDDFNDMNIAMTGDMVIRISQGTTVARGDLLMSAGDGTAKPQGDDIVRSKTIAKVTSTNVSHTYDDGSYLVPCVLMAC